MSVQSQLPILLRTFLSLSVFVMFLVCGADTYAKSNAPVLLSQADSTRAVALESITFKAEPFDPTSRNELATDQRTRIVLFCLNLSLEPGEDLSALSADAEDSAHHHYSLKVEYAGALASQPWLTSVILRLSDDLTDVGDVLIGLTYKDAPSNRVRVGIGHIGGGPPDDSGAQPTLAPPYTISGRITEAGVGLDRVQLDLTGAQTSQSLTNSDGTYSFTVTSFGDYTVTAAKPFYDFGPASLTFPNLSNSRAGNFNATRRSYTVNVRVTDENNNALDGISVSLINHATGTTTVQQTNGGQISFPGVAAGFDYQLAAETTNLFTFVTQNVNALNGNLQLNFKGARRAYSITGQIVDSAQQPVSAATINLGSTRTTQTDSDGNYSFSPQPAGFAYSLLVSKEHYAFNPSMKTVNFLDSASKINFNGVLRKYAVDGRVTNASGVGLIGITVRLSGSENATTITDATGDYSLQATALGTYSISASIEQNYYNFAPSPQPLGTLISDRTVDFTATLDPITNPFEVLEFDGSPKTVDYGDFWSGGVDLGHFFWEFWARPDDNAGGTYLLSDGYGGAHALLFGFGFYGASEAGRYQLFGDTFDGVLDLSHITFFGSDQGPAIGEWGHFAVGWDGQNIITYYDGVPVGKTRFVGPRQTPGQYGGGHLLIGGSDHNNFRGHIAQVRGYEERNPRADAGNGESSFTPETIFSVDGNLLSYYFRSAPKVADLSFGYYGTHVGVPRGTTAGIPYDCAPCAPPQFVTDPSAPNFPQDQSSAAANVGPPTSAPSGSRVFDSFTRPNSTHLFGAPGGLGATEAGAAGSKIWQVTSDGAHRQTFGILNRVAVLLGNDRAIAWLATGSDTGDLQIAVDRLAGSHGSGISTGLSFRVADDQNYFFAYTTGDSVSTQELRVGYYLNGQRTVLVSGVDMPQSWTTITIVTLNSGQIEIYADGSPIYSATVNALTNATGAGLYNNGPNMGLANRWDNFVVYDVP